MFYADTMIDTIQNGKHQFIKNYITNQPMADAWSGFVQTQSAFCHAIVQVNDTMMKQITEPLSAYWSQHLVDAWLKPGQSALKH